MEYIKTKYDNTVKQQLYSELGYKNRQQVPRLEKIVINRGLGEAIINNKCVDTTLDQLMRISGQKPVKTRSKKSISNFKIRDKQVIGAKVTLRGKKMYDFVTKLIYIVLPKIRDFNGIPKNSFDGRGNYTLGIKEDSIFPEIPVDTIDKIRGFDITFVTTADTNKEAFELLKAIGMPFKKTGKEVK